MWWVRVRNRGAVGTGEAQDYCPNGFIASSCDSVCASRAVVRACYACRLRLPLVRLVRNGDHRRRKSIASPRDAVYVHRIGRQTFGMGDKLIDH